MKRLFSLVGALALVAITCSYVLAAPPSGGGTSSVTVVNTSANPVPVTGEVGLAGTPTIIIGNTASNPIPIIFSTATVTKVKTFYVMPPNQSNLIELDDQVNAFIVNNQVTRVIS